MQNEHSANAGSAANLGGSEAKSESETEPLTTAPNGENRAPASAWSETGPCRNCGYIQGKHRDGCPGDPPRDAAWAAVRAEKRAVAGGGRLPDDVVAKSGILDLEELRSAGYLQEVNRVFFHPLGLALAIQPEAERDRLFIIDVRNDLEGFVFQDPASLRDKADLVEAERHRRRIARMEKFGYFVQPPMVLEPREEYRRDSREAINGRGTFHPAHSNHPLQDSACRIDLADAPRVTAGGMPLYDEAMAPHVVSGSVKDGTLSIGPAKTPEPPEPPIRTEKTPLSKLPRCLLCKEFVGSTFKVVDIHLGVVNPRGVQHVAGLALAHLLPLQLAEIFSAEPDPINVTADPRIDCRAYFCMECYALAPLSLPEIEELVHTREAREAREGEKS